MLGGGGPGPPTFWSGRTDPPLYKYTMSEILLGPPHFSDQNYATVWPPLTVRSEPNKKQTLFIT